MFNRSGTQSNPLSFPPSLSPVQNTKKRRRLPSECDELPVTANSDGKIKPRRIDPDRLAIRLGPELTSEMDAYILPGAKMPNFQIRQALVTKYNVDRRHIYDYFHSRGLRVAKEDKHLNLSHRMSRKPGAARKPAAPRKPAKSQVASSGSSSNALKSSDVIDSSTHRTEPPNSAAVAKLTNLSKGEISGPLRPLRPAPTSRRSCSPRLPSFLQETDLLSDTSSSEEGSSPMSPIFDLPDTLTDSSSFGEDLELLSLGYPISEKLSELFNVQLPPVYDPLEDPLFEINGLQSDMPQTCESSSISVRDSLLPLDALSRLSQSERIEFYNHVNAGIGPARGIEESAGTYKAHMEHLYLNRWHSAATHYHYGYPPASHPHLTLLVRPTSIIEKENINPQTSASRTAMESRPLNSHYYPQFGGPYDHNDHCVSVPSRHENPPTPLMPLSTNRLTNTPAPPPIDPLPCTRSIPLIWTSPIKPSPSVSFQLQPQQWPTQMSQPFPASQ